jgi:hypothetical protein
VSLLVTPAEAGAPAKVRADGLSALFRYEAPAFAGVTVFAHA